MPRIELNALVGNMTPEQKIMCMQFYARFDGGTAAHRNIVNVEPLHLISLAGAELETYAATKMYLCLQIDLSGNTHRAVGVDPYVIFYNEANVAFNYYTNKSFWYDTVAASFYASDNVLQIKNIYFSRLTLPAGYVGYNFIGYRITLN